MEGTLGISPFSISERGGVRIKKLARKHTDMTATITANAETGAGTPVSFPPSKVPADLSGTVTVNDVLEERRFELAFECKRWYDIARRQLGADVFSASGFEGAKPAFTSDDYLLPLPQDELERNPNLTQNPGY